MIPGCYSDWYSFFIVCQVYHNIVNYSTAEQLCGTTTIYLHFIAKTTKHWNYKGQTMFWFKKLSCQRHFWAQRCYFLNLCDERYPGPRQDRSTSRHWQPHCFQTWTQKASSSSQLQRSVQSMDSGKIGHTGLWPIFFLTKRNYILFGNISNFLVIFMLSVFETKFQRNANAENLRWQDIL